MHMGRYWPVLIRRFNGHQVGEVAEPSTIFHGVTMMDHGLLNFFLFFTLTPRTFELFVVFVTLTSYNMLHNGSSGFIIAYFNMFHVHLMVHLMVFIILFHNALSGFIILQLHNGSSNGSSCFIVLIQRSLHHGPHLLSGVLQRWALRNWRRSSASASPTSRHWGPAPSHLVLV